MDLDYQAIPHASPALERARHDADFCCELEFWSARARPDAMHDKMALQAASSQDAADHAFVDALRLCRQAARERPGLESRCFNWPGRGFDAVYFLLSPAHRSGQGHWSDPRDWAGEALFGAQVLAGTTTIGFRIRYTPPELVREHAELLQLVTQDDLREHFRPSEMEFVYKYFGQPDAFESWVWPQFEEWRGFLASMTRFADEGIICCVG